MINLNEKTIHAITNSFPVCLPVQLSAGLDSTTEPGRRFLPLPYRRRK